MISYLSIRQLTLIESLELDFEPGLTVFTGETGAGKSILLDALLLMMGAKSRVELIREGADELEVCAQFILKPKLMTVLNQVLQELDIATAEENTLLVKRIVSRKGKHRQQINGQMVTLSQLKTVVEPLVDFTAQHAGQGLLRSGGQMAHLDAYAGHEDLLKEMQEAFREYKLTEKKIEELQQGERDRQYKIDWLQFQVEEIERIAPEVAELDDLKKEREQLVHAEKIGEETARVLQYLSERDDGYDAATCLQEASVILGKIASISEELGDFFARLDSAIALVDDVCRDISRYGSKIQSDPERLQQVEDRLNDIQILCRKHGGGVERVLESCANMRRELDVLQNAESNLEMWKQDCERLKKRCEGIAERLSLSRKKHAKQLSQLVRKELADLGMPKVSLEVKVEATSSEGAYPLTEYGFDHVNIVFSANPGEPAYMLEKVASGGELSRILLAIKKVLATKDLTLVSIFDEIDTGVGGAIGEAIGEKLQSIASERQVLCVTHLAQIASRAHSHMKVEKYVQNNRTVSSVKALLHDERVEELARMLGGKTVTETTRKHALEFLQQAQGLAT